MRFRWNLAVWPSMPARARLGGIIGGSRANRSAGYSRRRQNGMELQQL
jgi:hypothetical protein